MKNSFQTVKLLSYYVVFGCCAIIMTISCHSSSAKAGKGDLSGYELTGISGTTVKSAVRKDPSGAVVIEGFAEGDKKTGQWIEYNNEGDITSISNYVNGLLEGPALKLSFRGQVDQRTTYHLNLLDGPWVQYKFGKIMETRLYKDGKLNGSVKTFDDKSFKLRQESEYRDGVLDGFYRYYDDDGNVSLQYQYKNGEKVSGGIVKKE